MLLAAAALAIAWAFVSLGWPLGYDHGIYVWLGDVVARGGMAYRDAWDMHGPLVGLLYAIPEWIFGRHAWGVRIFDLAMLGVGAVALHTIVRDITTPHSARWAVVVFVLVYASLGFNETAEPDGWVAMLGLVSLVPLRRRDPTRLTLLLVGLVIGALTAIKPFYALFMLAPLMHAVLDVPLTPAAGPRLIDLVSRVAAMSVGFMVPLIVMALWFAARGALDDLLEVHLLYTSRVYSGRSPDLGLRVGQVIDFFWRGKVVSVALPAIFLGAWVLWHNERRPFVAALVSWVVVAVACVAIQNKWYGYHWIPVLPPLVVLGAVGLDRMCALPVRTAARFFGIASFGVILFHAAIRPATYVAQWGAYAIGRVDRAAHLARFNAGSIQPLFQEQAAAHLRARSQPTDGIAVWGCDAALLYMSDRPTQFRLAGWLWPMATGEGTSARAEYRAEYLRSLRETRPVYIVVNELYGEKESNASLAEFPELAAHLGAQYTAEASFGPLRLYRLTP